MTPDEVLKRFHTLQSERKIVEQTWQMIERFVAPYKGEFFKQNSGEESIEWSKRELYDATAVQAHIQLASSLHGATTNPAIQWFDLQWRDKELQDNHDARIWLEKAAKRVFDELQDSNFNLEANQVYRGITSFATAAIVEEANSEPDEEWKGVNFSSVPLKECYFEPDDKGQCLNFYRHLQWRPSKLIAKFGKDNCPEKVLTAHEKGMDDPMSVIFCAFTRLDKQNQPDKVLTPENRPYGYMYVMRDCDSTDEKRVLRKGGYYEMPAYMVRWECTDESMWGNGPAFYALADILTLNELVQLDLRSREKVIDPALLVQERALVNQLDLSPGAQNVVRDPDAIRPFESAARFDAVESSIVRLQLQVQKYFYIDQLELKESPAMTATEVQVRYELMQRLLSSTMARLKEDFLNPLIERTLALLYRAGELGTLPEGVDNLDYEVAHIGPLSRSMKFDLSASIERWFTQLQLIAQSGDDAAKVLMVPDYNKIARATADALNLPTEFTRDPDEVDEDFEQQQERMARQANADAAAQETAAAKNLAQAEGLREGESGVAGGEVPGGGLQIVE